MRAMRRLGGAILLALLVTVGNPTPTFSDADLTSLVASAYFPRTEDASLHALAHERAAYQVAYSGGVCATGSLTHADLVTAEVLACNYTDAARAVEQWLGSTDHHKLLSDPAYDLIGCGTAAGIDGAIFYACTLSVAPVAQPTPAPVVPAPPAEQPPPLITAPTSAPYQSTAPLPDTRMPWPSP